MYNYVHNSTREAAQIDINYKTKEGDKETLKQNVSLVKRADSTHLSSVISGGTISNR